MRDHLRLMASPTSARGVAQKEIIDTLLRRLDEAREAAELAQETIANLAEQLATATGDVQYWSRRAMRAEITLMATVGSEAT